MAPSSGDDCTVVFPVEIWSNIISFTMDPDFAIFDDRLTVLHIDPNLLNLMLVNSFFKSCVESLVKQRAVVIKAGQEAVTDEDRASVKNYPHDIPFDQQDFNTEIDYMRLWDWDSVFIQCASLVSTIIIEITHPAELPQQASTNGAWCDILLHLRLLRRPLEQIINETRKIQVDFLSQTSIRNESPDICTFPGSPDTHWKYQPVQQVLTMLSYLSSRVGRDPWHIMTPPPLLIAQPKHATPLQLKQTTVNVEKSLRDAFNTDPSQTKGRQTHTTYDHSHVLRYHCFDETFQLPPNGANGQHLPGHPTTRTNFATAFLVLNLESCSHKTGSSKIKIIDNPYDLTDDQTCTIVPVSAPDSPGRTRRAIYSPNTTIADYQKRLRLLVPFPRIPDLSDLYDSLSSRLNALEAALVCGHVRLPTDLTFLLDTNGNGSLLTFSEALDKFQRLRIRTIREEYDLDELSNTWTANDPTMQHIFHPEAFDGTESAMEEDEADQMFGYPHLNEQAADTEVDDEEELEQQREWFAWRQERQNELEMAEVEYEDWRDDSWTDALEDEDMYD